MNRLPLAAGLALSLAACTQLGRCDLPHPPSRVDAAACPTPAPPALCLLPPCPYDGRTFQLWADLCWPAGTCRNLTCPHNDGPIYICSAPPSP